MPILPEGGRTTLHFHMGVIVMRQEIRFKYAFRLPYVAIKEVSSSTGSGFEDPLIEMPLGMGQTEISSSERK